MRRLSELVIYHHKGGSVGSSGLPVRDLPELPRPRTTNGAPKITIAMLRAAPSAMEQFMGGRRG